MTDDFDFSVPPQPFRVQCLVCYNTYEFLVDPEGYYKWRNQGLFIQDALPDNSQAERELLISRTCDDCFNKIFPEEEEAW